MVMPYDISGINIVLVLTVSALSLLYFYSGIAVPVQLIPKGSLPRASENNSFLGAASGLLGGMGASIFLLGLLFKIMHWPFANIQIYIGLPMICLSLLVSLLQVRKNNLKIHNAMIKRMSVFALLGILLVLYPGSWDNYRYRNHPQYLHALNAWKADPGNQELRHTMEKELERMKAEDPK